MSNAVEARLTPRRILGDTQIFGMRLFKPDGTPIKLDGESGAGGGSMIFSGGSEIDLTADPGTQHSFDVPFGEYRWDYVTGFDVNPGDLTFSGPAGAYLVKMEVNLNFDGDSDIGELIFGLAYTYPDPEGSGPLQDTLTYITVRGDHYTSGQGDYDYNDSEKQKLDLRVFSAPGDITMTVYQDSLELSMNVGIILNIIKL